MKAAWKQSYVLLTIVSAGALLRLYRLDTLPPAVFRDEAEKAYNAWSILRTGRAETGPVFPLFINVFGVTTSAIYQYFAVPFIALFGLNEWGARLPAAIVGIATLSANYAYVKVERGRLVALWATAFLALSPWHIPFSRWAQQGIFLPFLISLGMLCLALFVRRRRFALFGAAACFGSAFYAYEIGRLFVPAFLIVLLLIYRKHLLRNWKWTAAACVVFAVIVAPTVSLLLNQSDAAQARFRRISILQPGAGLPAVSLQFIGNYFAHFSPDFLLFKGDSELRHSAGVGQLNVVECLAAIAGVVALITRRKKPDLALMGWLLLFPAAAAMTREGIPHALRTIVALPVIQNTAAVGVVFAIGRLSAERRKPAFQLTILLTLLGFIPFAKSYYSTYSTVSAVNWQYGIKQALAATKRTDAGNVVLYNIVPGGEFLAAFYEKRSLSELASPLEGRSRFQFPPFNYPLEQLYAQNSGGPTAYIMLPLYPGPPGGRFVPIHPPGNSKQPPVCLLYLNDKVVFTGRSN